MDKGHEKYKCFPPKKLILIDRSYFYTEDFEINLGYAVSRICTPRADHPS